MWRGLNYGGFTSEISLFQISKIWWSEMEKQPAIRWRMAFMSYVTSQIDRWGMRKPKATSNNGKTSKHRELKLIPFLKNVKSEDFGNEDSINSTLESLQVKKIFMQTQQRRCHSWCRTACRARWSHFQSLEPKKNKWKTSNFGKSTAKKFANKVRFSTWLCGFYSFFFHAWALKSGFIVFSTQFYVRKNTSLGTFA